MARRSRGEGTIFRRSDGRWAAEVTVGWTGERRRIKTLYGRTRAEVSSKLRAAQLAQDTGDLTAGRAPLLGDWLQHWLTTIAAERVRPSTYAGYEHYIRDWLTPHLGRYRLDKLAPEHLEELYAHMRSEGRASATILQAHRILSRALKVAEQRGKVARNVATRVDAPTLHREEAATLSTEQARSVLAVAAGERNAPRWTIALALGLRQGEALGLTWDQVDLAAGTLRVRQALQRISGQGLTLVRPKSRAGSRTLPLPDLLVEQLRAHRKEQVRERLDLGAAWVGWEVEGQPVELVFAQANGKPIDARQDYAAWQRLLKAAGAPAVRLHDARHTAATMMLIQGVHPRVVMETLGHSSIQLTLGTYSHVAPELSREAAGRMNAGLLAPLPEGAAEAVTVSATVTPVRLGRRRPRRAL